MTASSSQSSRAIYRRDLVDTILSVTRAENNIGSYERHVEILGRSVPRERLGHAIATLNRELTTQKYLRSANGQISLTVAGLERLKKNRYPEGIPHTISLKKYAHEMPYETRSYDVTELQLLAILVTYDDPLTIRELSAEWKRRQGTRPDLRPVVNRLYEADALTVYRLAGSDRYGLSPEGLQWYERAMDLIVPRNLLRTEPIPMSITYADLRAHDSEPLLASVHIPYRLQQAIQHAAETLITDLEEAIDTKTQGSPAAASVTEILPRFFADRYDTDFLERFATVAKSILTRLQTNVNVTAQSVAEAIILRNIMLHARELVAANGNGTRSPSQRELRHLIYIDAHVFDDHFFERLYSAPEPTEFDVEDPTTKDHPDLSFANWFEPFQTQGDRMSAHHRQMAHRFMQGIEQDIRALPVSEAESEPE